MTIVKGQIDSLKRIISELDKKGISRFDSVGDIRHFLNNYHSEKQAILRQIREEVDAEIEVLENDQKNYREHFNERKKEEIKKLTEKIVKLRGRYDRIRHLDIHFLLRTFIIIYQRILRSRIRHLDWHFDGIIAKKTKSTAQQVAMSNKVLNEYRRYRENIISGRSEPRLHQLAYTKKVVDGLYTLIAGAAGENMVVNELQKLPDSCILFNDYSMQFEPPIYYKKENTRIYSIQIDHLLVTHAGVFIIETKNWSKQSIENLDLRSPVSQILRTNHALFKLLNGGSKKRKVRLNQHHWGAKKIPIKSVIVMINHKPREKFKYVAVKTLHELIRYINYFDPIFDDSEVRRICDYLDKMRDRQNDLSRPRRSMRVPAKPNLQQWLRKNPGKGINDYYRSIRH